MNDYTTIDNQNPDKRQAWRNAAYETLTNAGHGVLAASLQSCGDITVPGSVVFCDDCGFAKYVTYTCHSRLCAECEIRAQAERFLKYLPIIKASTQRKHLGYNFKHVTVTTNILLTDDSVVADVSEAWRIARKALGEVLFEKLEHYNVLSADEKRRKQANWKAQHIGAVAGGEFGGEGFRFHMHFFMYSPFIDHAKLTEALKRLSGGKWYVNYIKPYDDAEKGAAEVILKYVTKLSELPLELLPALQGAITGQRRVRCYGAWFGVPDETEKVCGCPECGNRLRHEQIPSQVEWETLLEVGVDAWYTWRHGDNSLLDLRLGNKSCEDTLRKPTWTTPRLL